MAGERCQRTRQVRFKLHRSTCRFLQAASRGWVFLCRQNPISFVAYELEFTPGPGHVLLDATADITGMVALMPDMETLTVPQVDYSNLSIFHVEQPSDFKKSISDVIKRAKTARPYAEWIKQTVMDNTSPGEKVLIAAHMGLFDHQYLEKATDPDRPLDWEGREVCTVHWGQGIGSNKWKRSDAVFLFSEFYVPRYKLIADAHAWGRKRPTDDTLRDAVGRQPRGDILTASEGHLLRWTKQLACRGNVRNIDAQGRCGRMRLYTSMDFTRLTRHQEHLFPGTRPPKVITATDNDRSPPKGIPGLCMLMATTEGNILWAKDIEAKTGIPTKNLTSKFRNPKVQDTADLYGWKLSSAKEVGIGGRSRCLVRSI